MTRAVDGAPGWVHTASVPRPVFRILIAALALASCARPARAPTTAPDLCPPRCVVRWTDRYPVPAFPGGRAGTWSYEQRRACDARCAYLGDSTPRCGEVGP